MEETFPVEASRAAPSMKVMLGLGVVTVGLGLINFSLRGDLAEQVPALVVLFFIAPGIWLVALLLLSVFSLRATDEYIQKLALGRWVVAAKPLVALERARVHQNTLYLHFSDGSLLRLAAMPLRDTARLGSLLERYCTHAQIE